jgi:DNA-binding NtrC family response regulator
MHTLLKIFVVDDEESSKIGLEKILSLWGYSVKTFSSAKNSIEKISSEMPDLIISDYKMEEMDGMEFLKILKKDFPYIPFIMLTAYGSEKLAVEAIKNGAFYYLKKPIEIEELKSLLEKIEKEKFLKEIIKGERNIPPFLTSSEKLKKTLEVIDSIAEKDVPVLIIGETGTGKELIARRIHFLSKRYKWDFIPINCSAIPENLFEVEFFGSEKGAFTGAIDKKGMVEVADKGTIFLDEITDLNLNSQAKLLRFLDSKEFFKVGGTKVLKSDVRIISATNKNIEELVKEKKFRDDLYYRVSTVLIKIPPLRERKEDIKILANYFSKLYSKEFNVEFEIDEKTIEKFKEEEWKGNVRELQSKIKRMILGVPEMEFEEKENPLALDDAILYHCLKILKNCNGNKSKAAEILKISRPTLDKILSRCKNS